MKSVAALLLALGLVALTASHARAIVGGAQPDESAAAHVVMLLKADERGSAFCTANVIARDVLLTAAHCVDKPEKLRIYWPGGDLLQEVRQVVTHPQFRPNAPKTRELSIDLAMVRANVPLPARFIPIPIDWDARIEANTRFLVAGYGLTHEGDPRAVGKLHAAILTVREPLSRILIWAVDPSKKGLGACTGDSGGPFLSNSGKTLAGITVWSQGAGKSLCGELTQALRLGPQRDFIEKTLRSWSAP